MHNTQQEQSLGLVKMLNDLLRKQVFAAPASSSSSPSSSSSSSSPPTLVKRYVSVYWDMDNRQPGKDWSEGYLHAIAKSSVIILLISPKV
jgi:beta-phosphoglucomutase-like phosphatase (HAD superfamily)